MSHCISLAFEALLHLFRPARGRHRPGREEDSAPPPVDPPPTPPRPAPAEPVLRGEDSPLVRPYLVAYEAEEARRRRAGQRELWLVVQGLDLGPRPLPRAEVSV